MQNNKRVLLALGGNAILQPNQSPTYENQLANVATSAKCLVKLVQSGYELAITHGNGPQVGNLLRQNEEAKEVVPPLPLDVISGESQGFIGYMLQNCMTEELAKAGVNRQVACILSRVAVDPCDVAFEDPTKPIGVFYDEPTARELMATKGWHMKSDAGRGWRRVVPSPQPQDIVEKEAILALMQKGFITISCGGGGIPVSVTNTGFAGVEAVIDKDLTGAVLASVIDADMFIIVTDVEFVFVHYGKPQQQSLGNITVAEMEKWEAEGHFSKGSMGPKVAAALKFVRRTGKPALICALDKVDEAVAGLSGTHILP